MFVNITEKGDKLLKFSAKITEIHISRLAPLRSPQTVNIMRQIAVAHSVNKGIQKVGVFSKEYSPISDSPPKLLK